MCLLSLWIAGMMCFVGIPDSFLFVKQMIGCVLQDIVPTDSGYCRDTHLPHNLLVWPKHKVVWSPAYLHLEEQVTCSLVYIRNHLGSSL